MVGIIRADAVLAGTNVSMPHATHGTPGQVAKINHQIRGDVMTLSVDILRLIGDRAYVNTLLVGELR